MLSRELLIVRPPLYSMSPSLLHWFLEEVHRERVAPIGNRANAVRRRRVVPTAVDHDVASLRNVFGHGGLPEDSSEMCKNCVRWARTWRQILASTESHRATCCGGKWLNRLRHGAFRCSSVSLTGFAFQACSFNHSDISPFRVNDLRAIGPQIIARRRPFRSARHHP